MDHHSLLPTSKEHSVSRKRWLKLDFFSFWENNLKKGLKFLSSPLFERGGKTETPLVACSIPPVFAPVFSLLFFSCGLLKPLPVPRPKGEKGKAIVIRKLGGGWVGRASRTVADWRRRWWRRERERERAVSKESTT